MAEKKVSKTNLFDDRDLKPEKTESPLDFLCKSSFKNIFNVELRAIFLIILREASFTMVVWNKLELLINFLCSSHWRYK